MFNELSFIARAALASVLGSACAVLLLLATQSPADAPTSVAASPNASVAQAQVR
jgi:hypothetical protein